MADFDPFASGAIAVDEPSFDPFEQGARELTPAPPVESSSVLRRFVADPVISLAKGIVSVPESIVGLADIPTMGYAGKALEAGGYGFQPKVTKDFLSDLYSPEQKAANARVEDAQGFVGTVKAMVENPSTIANTVVESVPAMLGGAAIARKAITSIPRLKPLVAGALGEGAVVAGLTAEQSRQQSDTGLITPQQAALATTTGAATGLIGVLGGGLAKRLGVTDIDTLLAGSEVADQAAKKNVLRRVVESAIVEGAFEELPQTAQEQIQSNIANKKPWDEGVAESAATGLLAGLVMGGAAGLAGGRPRIQPLTEEIDRAIQVESADTQMLGNQEAQPQVEVGLPPVVARDTQPQAPATEVRQETPVTAAPTQVAAPPPAAPAPAIAPVVFDSMFGPMPMFRATAEFAMSGLEGPPQSVGSKVTLAALQKAGLAVPEAEMAKATVVAAPATKPPELMTPEEFNAVKPPERFALNKALNQGGFRIDQIQISSTSRPQIQALELATGREWTQDPKSGEWLPVTQDTYLAKALSEKKPINATTFDGFGLANKFNTEGYIRQGDQYVYQPSAPNAPKETGPSSGALVTETAMGEVTVTDAMAKGVWDSFTVDEKNAAIPGTGNRQWLDLGETAQVEVKITIGQNLKPSTAETIKATKAAFMDEANRRWGRWRTSGAVATPAVGAVEATAVPVWQAGTTGKRRGGLQYFATTKSLADKFAQGGEFGRPGASVKELDLPAKKVLDWKIATPDEKVALRGDKWVEPDGYPNWYWFEHEPGVQQTLRGLGYDSIKLSEGEANGISIAVLPAQTPAPASDVATKQSAQKGDAWTTTPATKNTAELSAKGDYVISHRENLFTLSHRPTGKHEPLGQFKTLEEAKRAADEHTANKADASIISKLESLKLEQGNEGRLYSLPHPDAVLAIGRSVWNGALDIAIAGIKAGKAIGVAIDEAIAYIRSKVTQFDEAQARENLDVALTEADIEQPPASPETSPIGDKPPVITQVQGVPIGIEREAENIAAIQQTIRAQIFDGTQPVSDAATAQARALFGRMTDPSQKAAAVGEVLSITNAQMGPGLTLAELWRYAEAMVLTNSDDSFLREIVPHYQDFGLGEAGAGATAFGRGLRALQETDTLLPQLYEIEKERRAAAGQKMAVGQELLETLLAALKGEVPDADVLERKTRTVLGTKVKPEKVEEIVRVVRRKPVDPVTELINHFARLAGIKEITPEQHRRLVELAQKLNNPDLSIPERSELMDEMFSVFNTMKLPPSLLTRLASNLVATNLTGLRTLGVNIFSPNVQGLVELGLTGITSPRDFPAMLRGAIEGGKQWLTNLRYSMGRDAYSFLNNDYQAAQNVLKQIWQRGLAQIKSNSASERTRGLTNLIFGSQQYYMRLLNSVDNANGILRRQMQLALYSSQAMRRLGMSTAEIRDVADMFYLMRDQFYAQSIESGLTENQSKIRANALAYQEFVEFLNNELPSSTGSEIAKAATYEATSVLGRLTDGVKEIDEGGWLTRYTPFAGILHLSNWMRKQEGLMPAIGVALLGYVSVPYRTARYYAWNTPYGLMRLGYHKWRKSKGKESWWKQSLATEYQEQQRLKNAMAGSAVLAALTGLGIGLLKTSGDDGAGDDDDDGVYFTGNGPKNKNLRSAWIAKGFKPQSLVIFVDGKRISAEMSRSGEAFAHFAWLLAARDDRKWREKEATANNRQYITTPTKETAHAIGTYFGLVGQRGIFQTLNQIGNVASGQSDPMAFAASKGGSFIAGLFTPALGLQRSVQGLLEGPVDTSSVQSAFMANFPVLNIMGLTHPKVNAFGDKLYNPENAWFHKMRETGIPVAFSTNPTTENKRLYGLLVEKGVAPRELRRAVVEEKYGPISDEQFAQFAERSGRLVKQQVLNNEPTLRHMQPENVKKWLGKTTLNADALTAKGMGLEPVKPPTASTGASVSILPPMSASTVPGATAAVPGATTAIPRRTSGLSRISVGRRSYGPSLSRSLGRPRFSTVRGLGRRRSIVGRIGRRRATRPRRIRALVGRRRRVVRV